MDDVIELGSSEGDVSPTKEHSFYSEEDASSGSSHDEYEDENEDEEDRFMAELLGLDSTSSSLEVNDESVRSGFDVDDPSRDSAGPRMHVEANTWKGIPEEGGRINFEGEGEGTTHEFENFAETRNKCDPLDVQSTEANSSANTLATATSTDLQSEAQTPLGGGGLGGQSVCTETGSPSTSGGGGIGGGFTLGPGEQSVRKGTKLIGGKKPRVLEPHTRAELVIAQCKISQLESEVVSLRRREKRARVEEEGEKEEGKAEASMKFEQLHMLEQERRELLEQLSDAKELKETGHQLQRSCDHLQQANASLSHEICNLKSQLDESRCDLRDSQTRNSHLSEKLAALERWRETETIGLSELQESYERSRLSLLTQLREAEEKVAKLEHLELRVKELERRERESLRDRQCVDAMKQHLVEFGKVAAEKRLLVEENEVLRGKSDNVELLKVQLQSFRDKCSRFAEQEKRLAQLELENKELREITEGMKGTGEDDTPTSEDVRCPPALSYKLVQLQQHEAILLNRQGELETELKLSKQRASTSEELLLETRRQLAEEKEQSNFKDDKIHRLERRLLYVTRERDGCVNVLNSYKIDTGMEPVLREALAELAKTKERIADLEAWNKQE